MANNFNMSQSYQMGNASIGDDELQELLDGPEHGFQQFNTNGFNNHLPDQGQYFQNVSMGQQQSVPAAQMFSHTPADAPIRSPFNQHVDFNYNQYGQMHQFGSMDMQNGMQRKMMMQRQSSDGRSPMTPRIQALQIGTPDSMTHPSVLNQQAKMASEAWGGTPGSDPWESPLPSPHSAHPMHHAQISEIMAGKHASVPTKMEGAHSNSLPSFQSQEAKKKRRRESHNLVERRRRDNINERIQDLSKLVPQHRLEDEKVRKHIAANGPLSPQGPGVSPPQATSLLAGGSGRRATAGTITQGLPQEEKEKGPNKGDILNGAVAWMRDATWMLYEKEQQVRKLKAQLESLGVKPDIEHTHDEERCMSELLTVVERNGVDNFSYSRYNGTGLRVPGFTNWNGESLDPSQADVPIKRDPGSADPNDWFNGDDSRNSAGIKEEDELGMDLG